MKAGTKKTLRDYGIAIMAAVFFALLIRFFVIEAYRIPTQAMRPTLEPGDTIFVTKWPVGFQRNVQRGDVLVFESTSEPGRDYVKRALGLPGDLIEVRKGRVTLNGQLLTLPTAQASAICGQEQIPLAGVAGDVKHTYPICWEQPLNEDFGPDKVPAGSVFVLGDLRSQSLLDVKKRRSWGFIPLSTIKGRAMWIWLSIEPINPGVSPARFPTFRFERMFRRIE